MKNTINYIQDSNDLLEQKYYGLNGLPDYDAQTEMLFERYQESILMAKLEGDRLLKHIRTLNNKETNVVSLKVA